MRPLVAGMRTAALAVLVCVTASIVVAGSFLWIQGLSTVIRPKAFVSTDYFHDTTTPSTILDASRTIAFTFAFVTDQPWVSDGFRPYSATLVADPGASVSRILMGTIAVFLCDPQCSDTHFVDVDIEPLNETSPYHWQTYEPYLLSALNWGTSFYIAYNLACTIFFADGNHTSCGSEFRAYLGPVVTVPDNVRTGQTVVAYGGALFATVSGVELTLQLAPRRFRPSDLEPTKRQ